MRIRRVSGAKVVQVDDEVAIEEPLEIRLSPWTEQGIQSRTLSVTMRTPGHDAELATGFAWTEGVLQRREDLVAVRHCGPDEAPQPNVIKLILAPGAAPDWARLERHVYTTSSCGVCGKTSIDAVFAAAQDVRVQWHAPPLPASTLVKWPDALRTEQHTFGRTGGLHAAGLFCADASLELWREDVGRHNAVDKLVGEAFLRAALPLTDRALLLSGRASFELVQKAAMAGIAVIAAVGAPSSLAVEAAERMNITLVGFLRAGGFNIYTHPERIA